MSTSDERGFRILHPETGRAAMCEPVLRSLPMWFGIESAIVGYVEAIERMPTVVAIEDTAIGFMTIEQHFPDSFELHVLGVRPEWHRRGVGQALLSVTEDHVRSHGGRLLQVKTLSPRRDCPHYESTRRWYLAMGFSPLTELLTLWDEDNPCLQMIKVLD